MIYRGILVIMIERKEVSRRDQPVLDTSFLSHLVQVRSDYFSGGGHGKDVEEGCNGG